MSSLLNKRYEIIKPIKSGCCREVYLAKDHNLGIEVALKGSLYEDSQDQVIQFLKTRYV
jgi:serine/threonine protein kinase